MTIGCVDVDESGGAKKSAHLVGVDHREAVAPAGMIAAGSSVVGMRRVGQHLVDEQDSAVRSEHAGDLGDAALRIDPVVHRVHCPNGIDALVSDGDPFCGTVDHLDVGTTTTDHAPHGQELTHERRGLHGDHMGAGRRRSQSTRSDPGTDVDHSLPRHGVDYVDDEIVDRRMPHPREHSEVTLRACNSLIVRVAVSVSVIVPGALVRHSISVSQIRSRLVSNFWRLELLAARHAERTRRSANPQFNSRRCLPSGGRSEAADDLEA